MRLPLPSWNLLPIKRSLVNSLGSKGRPSHKEVGRIQMNRSEPYPHSLLEVAEERCKERLQQILEKALTTVRGSRGFIALVDSDTGELVVQFCAGEGWDEEKRQRRLRIGQQEGKGITAYVAASGKPYLTGDVTQDPYYLKYFDDVRSEVAVPLKNSYGRIIGIMNIESNQYNAFNERDVTYLEALAAQAAMTLSMADYQARERALLEVGNELTLSTDPDALMNKVVQTAAQVLRADDCSLFLLDEAGAKMVLRASKGSLAQQIGQASYLPGQGLTGWVLEKGKPARTGDPRTDPRWKGVYPEFPPGELGAYLGVPVFGMSKVLGVLRVVRRKRSSLYYHHEFTDEDEGLLMTLANQIGVAIESAKLLQRLVQSERMAAWGELSARSAHMIGNRVFALRGYVNELEYLVNQSKLDPSEISELINGLKRGIERLEQILQEFRDFVLATHLSRELVEVNAVVKQAVEEGIPCDCHLELHLDLAEGLPKIYADPGKLLRALTELIENSVVHQEGGGYLRLRTGLAGEKELSYFPFLRRNGGFVKIELEDHGPGIPKENKAKIFTPFFTTRAKGMGLGLSIVKGIVEAHGGAITEIGEEGKGARFLLLFPIPLEVQSP